MKKRIETTLLRVAQLMLLFCAALTLQPSDAGAVGFRLPNQDPEAIARGNAFVATADNPSAIYYNPAGITQIQGQNLSAGLYLVSAGDTFTSTTGATAWTDPKYQAVPQLYYVYTPTNSVLSFGIGLYVPYGLSLDWGYNPPFRNVAQSGNLQYIEINPVVAWKITPELSVGIGPSLNYSKAVLSQGVGLGGSTIDEFRFEGEDINFGFNGGVLWQPVEKWSFGLNYHSETSMNYKGHSTYNTGAASVSTHTEAQLTFPQYVVAGVSFRPTTNWNVEFDYDWTDWGTVNQIVFSPTPLNNITFPFNYHSSSMYEIGVTRQLPNNWYASLGYFYSENSVPDTTFNPIIPDSALHLGSFGFGHKGVRMDWSFSYTIAINPGRTVGNSSFDTGAPGTAVNGTYKTINNALNFAVNLKF